MTDLASFPITQRWPAKYPDRIQLYSFPTPNGVKVSIALEELGLPYEAHTVSILDGDQHTEEFRSLNPNGKIPAIVDPNSSGGEPLGLFESGAILVYLGEKTGNLLPSSTAGRLECLQWMMFQMGGIGPMFGQFGYFYKFAGKEIDDKRAMHRYRDETKRLLGVLENRLTGRSWIMDDGYTMADIINFPWVRTLREFYEADDELGLNDFPVVMDWLERCLERPASQRGLTVPPRS